MTAGTPHLGVGIGWRRDIDITVERLDVDFVECVAEDVNPRRIPESLRLLRERGLPVLPHAVSLSLAGAQPVDTDRVRHLARVATALDAPLVSDHVAFTRAGSWEAGHILPTPRTTDSLDVLVENVRRAQGLLPVPLALEHVAALVEWPGAEFSEAEFLSRLVDRTDCRLILDVANLYANAHNLGTDPREFLDAVPLDRIAYVHVGGGTWRDGVYHDTHAHPVLHEVLDLLAELHARTSPPGVLLERDDQFPSDDELAAELTAIRTAIAR
ncbi:DUF692 domain-containing protein [Saccharopolyspora mangrovi]|uniref:DUF692 domain-containing protein n=1 Tax=Saccharopolyspora mangrovi TaxID=3082379 RepID=A0ABU6AJ58_9PSEU|nr:DUF692 domain-containing protein [Saccharopolyspora sp. S2-29]MEB3371588.1 DUF692 domain-containing protein [Saccharopolyspora sp. S2-29]